VHAAAWASRFDALMFDDTMRALAEDGAALRGTVLAAAALVQVLHSLLGSL
jgi:hypothetical protein